MIAALLQDFLNPNQTQGALDGMRVLDDENELPTNDCLPLIAVPINDSCFMEILIDD